MAEDDGQYSEEELKKSEEFKEKGNIYFKDNKFEQSAEMYAEAILCKISPSKKSIIYCNRALAQLKLENYGIALVDAVESAKLDPTNVKSYYRRA